MRYHLVAWRKLLIPQLSMRRDMVVGNRKGLALALGGDTACEKKGILQVAGLIDVEAPAKRDEPARIGLDAAIV